MSFSAMQRVNPRWLRLSAFAVILLAGLFVAIRSFRNFDDSLTTGLEEEKSYTRHAMEYHRTHPDKRKGDVVLEVWSDADYIAQYVAQQNSPNRWAAWSDNLSYLPERLKDHGGHPYCVVESPPETIVLWFLSAPPANCNVISATSAPLSSIQSGDLEFSGREDYWIYVLRRAQK
jgi:hypothetical protein